MSYTIIYTTFQNRDDAVAIAKILLKEKLSACCNIIDQATSLYNWNGKVEESNETLMITKTIKVKVKNVISRIKQLHKYECPCILAFDITEGDIDYLNWIKNSV